MRGNNVMLGYYANPKATESHFRAVGSTRAISPWSIRWLHRTARPHERHRHFRRRKHLSIEVERPSPIIRRWPRSPSSPYPTKVGRSPEGFVTLKQGCDARPANWTTGAARAYFKAPKYVEFGALPRTATGKIRKNELRSKAKS
jgi:fatty-acyl-CoA synthase